MTAEEAVFKAVLEDDTDLAIELLEDFFPTELKRLSDQLDRLSNLIDVEMTKKGAR